MAIMYPPRIAPGTKSPGEREVFRRLRDDPATKEWLILHSLDIANHMTQLSGELDFVVIVPGHGVLCLEVKGCRSLRRENGLWFYGVNSKPDARGPFRQASDSMHSIRTYLAKRDENLRPLLFWSAVLFPYVDVSIESNEWHAWQLLDGQQFRQTSLSALLTGVLDHAHKFLSTQSRASWYHPERACPSAAKSKLAASYLRPHFEFFESPEAHASRRAEEIKHYTEEQFGALDAMEDNERVIFTGPAGTGKTLLALEAARRAAMGGDSVLLVCFNRLLGSWLREQIEDMPQVTAGTLHRHMLSVAGASPPDRTGHTFWSSKLPDMAIGTILNSADDAPYLYDLIVIDEAQDVLSPVYLDYLDLCLRGGLRNGRWLMFGDFEMQMIYGSRAGEVHTILAQRLGPVMRYSLRTNCRNTPRIAETVRLLSQMDPGYKRVLRPDNHVEPRIHTYSTENHKRKLLIKSVEKLLDEGFSATDIVILTSRADESAIPSLLGKTWSKQLLPLTQSQWQNQVSAQCIRHGTIHYFKGMEAPAIIVAGIDDVGSDKGLSLLYVALSRALHRLVLLVSNVASRELLEVLAK